jgi:hypothetical protein
VQRCELIQIADPDVANDPPDPSARVVEPVLRWVVDALWAPVQAAGGRDDLAWRTVNSISSWPAATSSRQSTDAVQVRVGGTA